MDDRRDGGNAIHIIGGDEADERDDKPIASTWHGEGSGATASIFSHDGDGAMLSESSQIPTCGSSSLVVVENDRSYKPRHCKNYYTQAGCPFGDSCIYIHDEEAKTRESLAIIVGSRSSGGYRDGVATGYTGGPAAPLPAHPLAAAATTRSLAQMPLAQTVSSGTVKPLNWRSRICSRWEQSGYCQYGSKCCFAHGEAELQRYGGGRGEREANPYNQRVMIPNLAAASAADAGGSGQMSGAMQRPIPSRNSWKVPKKLIGIYADWIDDDE